MLTEKDFIERFSKYTDQELYDIYKNSSDYSKEALNALHKIINCKGGIQRLENEMVKVRNKQSEVEKIIKETRNLSTGGADADFIKTMTTSTFLSKDELASIIEKEHSSTIADVKDREITSKTITGSFLGIIIAGLVGGLLFGIQLIFTARIFYILLAGLALLCYFIIKGITKQSKNNTAVFVATIISTVISFLLGYLIYSIVGYIK